MTYISSHGSCQRDGAVNWGIVLVENPITRPPNFGNFSTHTFAQPLENSQLPVDLYNLTPLLLNNSQLEVIHSERKIFWN